MYYALLKKITEKKFRNGTMKFSGVIEFVDSDEANFSLIAMTREHRENDLRHTHMEIHPSLIMGFLGFNIPYFNCSPHPRNVYGTGQTKQSVGCIKFPETF